MSRPMNSRQPRRADSAMPVGWTRHETIQSALGVVLAVALYQQWHATPKSSDASASATVSGSREVSTSETPSAARDPAMPGGRDLNTAICTDGARADATCTCPADPVGGVCVWPPFPRDGAAIDPRWPTWSNARYTVAIVNQVDPNPSNLGAKLRERTGSNVVVIGSATYMGKFADTTRWTRVVAPQGIREEVMRALAKLPPTRARFLKLDPTGPDIGEQVRPRVAQGALKYGERTYILVEPQP